MASFHPVQFTTLSQELTTINAQQQYKHGDEQRPEHQPDKAEQLQAGDHTKDGDERVNISYSFINNKPEQVIYQANKSKTPYRHGNSAAGMALCKQHYRQRHIH